MRCQFFDTRPTDNVDPCALGLKILLVEGRYPQKYGGRLTGIIRADEGGLSDKHILIGNQGELEVTVLASSVGTLGQRHV